MEKDAERQSKGKGQHPAAAEPNTLKRSEEDDQLQSI